MKTLVDDSGIICMNKLSFLSFKLLINSLWHWQIKARLFHGEITADEYRDKYGFRYVDLTLKKRENYTEKISCRRKASS